MSMYWPEFNVALEITDNPMSTPFDSVAHPEVKVVRITCAQMDDPAGFNEIAAVLAAHMGKDFPPQTPGWAAKNRALRKSLGL